MNWYAVLALFFKLLNSFIFLALFYYIFVKKIRPALYDDIALEEQDNILLHNRITILKNEYHDHLLRIAAEKNDYELLRHKLMFWSARVEYGAFLAEKERAERLVILQEREHVKQELYVKERLFQAVVPVIHARVLQEVTIYFANKERSVDYLDHILDFLDKQGE